MLAKFKSATWPTTLNVISDNTTVNELIFSIKESCNTFLDAGTIPSNPSPFNESDPNVPKPEQTIQYYRASSVALTLEGYNNTAALFEDENAPPTPLPAEIDRNFVNCVNETIGAAVPLIDGAITIGTPNIGLFALFATVYWFLSSSI